jgi:hypothetical protein
MPSEPGRLRDLVVQHMIHSENHLNVRPDGTTSRCNVRGKCCWDFPHPPRPYTQLNAKQRVDYKRGPGDAWVSPHCPALLLLWEGHMHVEIIFTVDVFLYVYKYLFKGPDHANVAIKPTARDTHDDSDPVADYIRHRYISVPEAAWRIFGFKISQQNPSVARLAVHEPGQNRPQYRVGARNANSSDASSLIRYFMRPNALLFDSMLYTTYNTEYTFTPMPRDGTNSLSGEWWIESEPQGNLCTQPRIVRRRVRGEKVARIKSVRPGMGEVFYIRLLLFHKPARSFEELRTVSGSFHDTFEGAARAAGLLQGDDEGRLAMEDAIAEYRSPSQLRFLFAKLITEGAPAIDLWERFRNEMALDYAGNMYDHVDPQLRTWALEQALRNINEILRESGKTTVDFGLPAVRQRAIEAEAELAYFAPFSAELRHAADTAVRQMSADQRQMYEVIENDIYSNPAGGSIPRMHFLTGKAGRGKSFVVNAVISKARSLGHIAVVCGTTALCVSNIEGARTAHSMFSIPVAEDYIGVESRLQDNDSRADYLREASFIVWDELPMANVSILNAVDQLMRRIMQIDCPFGGKVFIGIGDFRQVGPVVKNGGPTACFLASVLSSPLWKLFRIHSLTAPIRNAGDPEFADFIDSIGEDISGSRVNLHPFLYHSTEIDDVRNHIFPSSILAQPSECLSRAFLTPLNVDVDEFNDEILTRLPGNLSMIY